MNKRGFTLIELVGSIVIIAILALLAFPALMSMFNKGQEQVDDSVKEIVISAAANCVNENVNDYSMCSAVDDLKENGYISVSFYDKYCEIHDDTITIIKNGTKYTYTYNSNEEDSDCN